MGKTSNWFRGLLRFKKPEPPSAIRNEVKNPRRRWSFFRTRREEKDFRTSTNGADKSRASLCVREQSSSSVSGTKGVDPSRHAIAVAAATAAVAEAAVAAAQAAAAVVKLTSSGRSCSHVSFGRIPREDWAAVRIQAAFRAYLARRALRALKALVKLQARVRGHIIRKQTADMLRGIQALLRAQARARSGREHYSESSLLNQKSSKLQCLDPATPENFEQAIRANAKYDSSSSTPPKRSGWRERTRRMEERLRELQSTNNSVTTSRDSTTHYTAPSPSSCEVQSTAIIKLRHPEEEEETFSMCSANSSLQYLSASSSKAGSSKGGGVPRYMTCTESSRAKLRSHSAPKQRPPQERRNLMKKNLSVHGFGDMHSGFASGAYSGSGRLDRLGLPYHHAVFATTY